MAVDGRGAPKETVWHRQARFPKKRPSLKLEDAAPELVQMNGNDRKICPLDDLFEATLKGQQMPDAADTFGEDANHLALFQFLARALQRMDNVTPIAWRDGDGLHEAEKPVEPSDVVVFTVQHKPNEPGYRSADQKRIDEGNVIRDQQGWTVKRNVLLADNSNAIQSVGEHPKNEANEIGQEVERVKGQDESQEPQNQDDLIRRQIEQGNNPTA